MKRFYMLLVSICVLVASSAMLSQVAASPDPATATVYVYPSAITVTAGQNYTVELRIENVINLYAWGAGVTWNPAALECLNFTEGPFLKTGGDTLEGVVGTIDNTVGEIWPGYAYTLLYPAVDGVNGSGTLANITFRAKATGTFNVHPAEVSLADPLGEIIPVNVVDVFTVATYNVVTVHDLANFLWGRFRVSDYAFNGSARELIFNVTVPRGGTGFCNVTIPNMLLYTPEGDWTVLIGGENATYTLVENETHSSLYFAVGCSECPGPDVQIIKVQIRGTYAFPDFESPVADAGADQTVYVGETVTFDASGSTDNVGIVNYTWDFGDGNVTSVTGSTITHVYTETGTYTVTLTVKDAWGNSDTDTVTVTVEEAPPPTAFPWWIAAVAGVVVVVVAAAVILMRRKPSG